MVFSPVLPLYFSVNGYDLTIKRRRKLLDEVFENIPGIQVSVHDDVFGTYTWRAKLRGLNFNDGYGLILIDGQRAMGCGRDIDALPLIL